MSLKFQRLRGRERERIRQIDRQDAFVLIDKFMFKYVIRIIIRYMNYITIKDT